MPYAAIGPIAVHLPEKVETNDDLAIEHPEWAMDLIGKKTGILRRHIAAPDECASDLAVEATRKLIEDNNIDPSTIDFLLLCTQTPDYPLPTTACLLQERLGLPTTMGALDFNLGCSGFVYGLSLADGLIQSGASRRVLLLTAETYSKYIEPNDRSIRPIFGDAAAATLIEAAEQPTIGSFAFGTDGGEANTLMGDRGGARPPEAALKPSGRRRWKSCLYMDGPGLLSYTAEAIPPLSDDVLAKGSI
ncbi:MAG: ketoacyl-ACP synthase III, partial [Pirellulales bacterium]|nr:ketoacyl-ACP synthase III [Pirellulales bacterium]